MLFNNFDGFSQYLQKIHLRSMYFNDFLSDIIVDKKLTKIQVRGALTECFTELENIIKDHNAFSSFAKFWERTAKFFFIKSLLSRFLRQLRSSLGF